MSKFRPPSYRSSRDPDSFGGCDVITPLSFIISIDSSRSVKGMNIGLWAGILLKSNRYNKMEMRQPIPVGRKH